MQRLCCTLTVLTAVGFAISCSRQAPPPESQGAADGPKSSLAQTARPLEPSAAPPPSASTANTPERQRAIAALEKAGATLEIDDQGQVHRAELTGAEVTDETLLHLAALPELESLEISGARVTDLGLASLHKLTNLQRL